LRVLWQGSGNLWRPPSALVADHARKNSCAAGLSPVTSPGTSSQNFTQPILASSPYWISIPASSGSSIEPMAT